MKGDHDGMFCLVATSLAQALTTVVTRMAHSRYDPIIFDRPGEVFRGLGYPLIMLSRGYYVVSGSSGCLYSSCIA